MNEITPIHILISDQFPTSHLLRFLVSQNYLSFFFCGGGGVYISGLSLAQKVVQLGKKKGYSLVW